ncbi:LysR family transcriptional regulator [Neorhizobium sp. P12A]|uniref:LysR family transcriptional regulator n=1 Tax=Neorhizobium sp. P12A TaxID=2268027 RepID=UPI0011EBBA80|nr:LysR family transcriptional regulator [Neorhizobium sp. P12A]KAA0701075.1 LysR family transcriptional regulator [Neorhizobium sp. P12A]
MKRHDFDDLAAFVIVAEERSFTRAAARLDISSSGLSHIMRLLEERLGVRLLARTTRSVATTEAGERLLQTLRPAFADIGRGLQALGELREKPSGTVRITAGKHAAVSLVTPILPSFHRDYPDIRVELIVGDRLEDIVASRFDAGIRFGERIDKDMVGIRIGPDIRAAVVGAPSYFAQHPPPKNLQDLANHDCVTYYMTSAGGPYWWEFEEDGRDVEVKVSGSFMVNDSDMMIAAALAGSGLVYVFEDFAEEHLRNGRLVRVLEDYCKPFPGYSIYYPSRRQMPPALSVFVEALRSNARRARNQAAGNEAMSMTKR